jgi:hypothetical protein
MQAGRLVPPMRGVLLLVALALPLSGCSSDPSAPVADLAPAAPGEPWNFTATRVLSLDGAGACEALSFPVVAGTASLDLFVHDPLLLTAHGLNQIEGAGRVRIAATTPDGSPVALTGLVSAPNPQPYGWAATVKDPMTGAWTVTVTADPVAVDHRIDVQWSEAGTGTVPTSREQSATQGAC